MFHSFLPGFQWWGKYKWKPSIEKDILRSAFAQSHYTFSTYKREEKKKICNKQKIGSLFIYLITKAISFIAYLQEYLFTCCQKYHNLFIQRLCVNESFLILIK